VLITVDTSTSFVAERRPESELYQQVSKLDPANPFVTLAHAGAEEEMGGEPWLLGCHDLRRAAWKVAHLIGRAFATRRRALSSTHEESAFARLGLFPPPAPGTMTLTGLDRTRARRAADAGKLAIVQRIVREPVQADVLPHLLVGPV